MFNKTPKTAIGKAFKWFAGMWGFPIAFFIGWLTPFLLKRFIDPQTAPMPVEYIQNGVWAILTLLLFDVVAWIGSRLNEPVLFKFYVSPEANNLTTWQKSVLLYSLYFGRLLMLVALTYIYAGAA